MEAIMKFIQQTGFYMFIKSPEQLLILLIASVLLYLAIGKKFEPLLIPIAFGMLCTNLPGADMLHEILFAGGYAHWDLICGAPVAAEMLAELMNLFVKEKVDPLIGSAIAAGVLMALLG